MTPFHWNEHENRAPLQSVQHAGMEFSVGDRVRLWPRRKADIMDIALKGKLAVIEAIEQDFEDQIHLAVVVDDDPGRDMGLLRQIAHRFFFSLDEVEPAVAASDQAHEHRP